MTASGSIQDAIFVNPTISLKKTYIIIIVSINKMIRLLIYDICIVIEEKYSYL